MYAHISDSREQLRNEGSSDVVVKFFKDGQDAEDGGPFTMGYLNTGDVA